VVIRSGVRELAVLADAIDPGIRQLDMKRNASDSGSGVTARWPSCSE
jgi:hypothetical protein